MSIQLLMNKIAQSFHDRGVIATLVSASQSLRSKEPQRVKIDDILRIVAKHYGVQRGDLLSSRRNQSIVRPRQIGMYLAKTLTSRSLPEIGRRFGGRDHTTVLHAIRKIESLKQNDGVLKEELESLSRMLKDGTI